MNSIIHDIALNLVALDSIFEDFEFLHMKMGPTLKWSSSDLPSPEKAELFLRNIYNNGLTEIEVDDIFPTFRRTYVKDLLKNVLTQVDFFVLNNPEALQFSEIITNLIGQELPQPFSIFQIAKELNQLIDANGKGSIKKVLSNMEKESTPFKNKEELNQFILKFWEKSNKIVINGYQDFFDFPIEKIVEHSSIKLNLDQTEDISCAYKYMSNYNAEIHLTFSNSINRNFVQNFLFHEYFPGHHLYYCLRELNIKNNSYDDLHCIDPFYSPENIINEGLATCSDIVLENHLTQESQWLLKIDRILFKAFYNIWHGTFINPCDISKIEKFLELELGIKRNIIEKNKQIFLEDLKYYMPSYPIGMNIVENFTNNHSRKFWKYLYQQHSPGSLKKLEREINRNE